MDGDQRGRMATQMSDETARARTGLLDALEALGAQKESIVLVGAQAIYLRTGRSEVALAEFTTDADLAVDPRKLRDEPLIEAALAAAGVIRDPANTNPGAWVTSHGIPIDLMVPEALATGSSRRSAVVPPHDRRSMRRTKGLEAALVDNSMMTVHGLEQDDAREIEVCVAGPAALLVAKLHKLGDRRDDVRRQEDKDAHDIYRLLRSTSADELEFGIRSLLDADLSATTARAAMTYLDELFAAGDYALGSRMAGRAESIVGNPAQVSLACSFLAADLLSAIRSGSEQPPSF